MESKNIFLFMGEEKYLLNQELNRWKDGFISKFGINSFFAYDNQNFSSDEVIQSLYAGGLFTSKKMLVIKGLPLDTYESNKISSESSESFIQYFQKNGSQIPDDTILIFVSYKPDGRSAFLKSLKSTIIPANIKIFDKLKSFGLKAFVRQQLGDIQVHELDIEYFLIKVGEDLYRIVYECQKLVIRCQIQNIQTIDHNTIDDVCFGMVQSNTFEFFDNLFTDQSKTLAIINKVRDDGINRNQFSGTLYRGLKTYLFIIDLYSQGITDPKQIVAITKLHPYVVSKNLKNINLIQKNYSKIKDFYTRLTDLNFDIKTGKFPDTYFRLGIKKIILE